MALKVEDSGNLYRELAFELGVPRDLAKTVLYLYVYDATPLKIGKTLLSHDVKSYDRSSNAVKSEFDLVVEVLGKQAIVIIEKYIVRDYKFLSRQEMIPLFKKDVDMVS